MARSATRRPSADGTQTVHRALDILEAFAAGTPALSLTEVSAIVGLTVPTTHRLLRSLQSRQMLIWDKVSRNYSLGSGVIRLASAIYRRDDLLTIAEPVLAELRSLTGETASLHWLVGHERVCLVELVSLQPIRMASGIGRSYPLYAGAAGKAILAWRDPKEVDGLLAEVRTGKGRGKAAFPVVPSKLTLARELTTIRRHGYATSLGETVPGAGAIAVPLLDLGHHAFASINVTGPVERWNARTMPKAGPALLRAAADIMSLFGHDAGPAERKRTSATNTK